MKMQSALCAMSLCLFAGSAMAQSQPAVRAVQHQAQGIKVQPLRYAPIAKINGEVQIAGEWRDCNPAGGTAATWKPAFDSFEADAAGAPTGGNTTCGLAGPGYRYFFGPTYLNPFATGDMTLGAGFGGDKSERVEFAWNWGSLTPKQCFVAIDVLDTFGECTLPDAADFLTGYVFDFGPLTGGAGYFYTDVDLQSFGAGDFFQLPVDGKGAYDIIIANAFDEGTGILTLDTTLGTQSMLWGTGDHETNGNDGRIGTEGPNEWSDDVVADGDHALNECYDNSGLVPCFSMNCSMILFYVDDASTACYPDCEQDNDLDIDDFVCFQTFFAFGDPYADCEQDNDLDVDDFICFQTFFAIGC